MLKDIYNIVFMGCAAITLVRSLLLNPLHPGSDPGWRL